MAALTTGARIAPQALAVALSLALASPATAAKWIFAASAGAIALESADYPSPVPLTIQVGRPIKKATIDFDLLAPDIDGASVQGAIVRTDGTVEPFTVNLFAIRVSRWAGSVGRRYRLGRGDLVEISLRVDPDSATLAGGFSVTLFASVTGRFHPKGSGGPPLVLAHDPPADQIPALAWELATAVSVPLDDPPRKVKSRLVVPANADGVELCGRFTQTPVEPVASRVRVRALVRHADGSFVAKRVGRLAVPDGTDTLTWCAPSPVALTAGDQVEVTFRLLELGSSTVPIVVALEIAPQETPLGG